jgi:hypothetical protein
MTRIKNKAIYIEGEEQQLSHDEKENRIYSRIEASIVFPGSAPGAIVVVAEEQRQFGSGTPTPFYVLAEISEQWDMGNILRKHLELKAEFQITECMSPPSDTSINFLRSFNASQRERHLEEVHLNWPPSYQAGIVNYHVAILKESLRNESRRLHIPIGSAIAGHLKQIPLGQELKDSEHPLIAALAYLTTKFVTQPYVMETSVQRMCKTDYPLFTRNRR